jgi:uncharacterized membrane protein YgcG
VIDAITAAILAGGVFMTVSVICTTVLTAMNMTTKRRVQDEAEDLDAVQADALAAKADALAARKATDELVARLGLVENRTSAIANLVNKTNPRVKV